LSNVHVFLKHYVHKHTEPDFWWKIKHKMASGQPICVSTKNL